MPMPCLERTSQVVDRLLLVTAWIELRREGEHLLQESGVQEFRTVRDDKIACQVKLASEKFLRREMDGYRMLYFLNSANARKEEGQTPGEPGFSGPIL